MTPHPTNVLAVCLALCLGAVGCTGKSSAFPLGVQEVQQMSPTNSTRISFEERNGEIFVSVTDQLGDSHIHKLEYGTLSKQQALEILKQKQIELETRP
jgi:hypothetical protein